MERRSFLALGAGVLSLAACTGQGEPLPDVVAPTAPDPVDPDAALRAAAAATELALIAAYSDVIEALADPPRRLRRFLSDHVAHLERMTPGASVPARPATAKPPTLRQLQRQEVQARKLHVAGCDAAVDPGLARELCLIAASEAQHATLLPDVRRRLAADP